MVKNVRNLTLNEEAVRKKLAQIIHEIGRIDIVDDDISLFSYEYNLSAELLVYVLLRASKEFGVQINDNFINSLGDFSFYNIINLIVSQTTNQIANSNS